MSVPAITKAVAVLRDLASSGEPVTLARLALDLNLPKSSLHDVCTTLVESGLVEKDGGGGYLLGPFVVELARQYLSSTDLVGNFLSLCRSLELNEAIVLSVLNGTDVVYVACVNADRPLAIRYQIGMRLPAAFTASGKAILATKSDAEVRSLLGVGIDSLVHPGTSKSTVDLLAELALIRERGYSIDDEETAVGMICLGAPVVQGRSEECHAAVAISMVKSSSRPIPREVPDEVRRIAAMLSTNLGAATGWRTGDTAASGPSGRALEH